MSRKVCPCVRRAGTGRARTDGQRSNVRRTRRQRHSCVRSSYRYGEPVSGTSSHSGVLLLVGSLFVIGACNSEADQPKTQPQAEPGGCQAPGWNATLESTQVPADGVLIWTTTCYEECVYTPGRALYVREAATAVEHFGTITRIGPYGPQGNYLAWRPSALLPQGAYLVDLPSHELGWETHEMEVVPARAVDVSELEVTATISVVQNGSAAMRCCSVGPRDECPADGCYSPPAKELISVQLDWAAPEPSAQWDQYVSWVVWDGDPNPLETTETGEPESWAIGSRAGTLFDPPRDEYCYAIYLKSLIDESMALLEDACIAHPDAGPALDPSTVIRDSFAECDLVAHQ
jgi:hypothetical protein